MKRWLVPILLVSAPVLAQSHQGELRLTVTDAAGAAVRTNVDLLSVGNRYRRSLTTSAAGALDVPHLAYGAYRIEINQPGFATFDQTVAIDSELPVQRAIRLVLPSVVTRVDVRGGTTLIDPGSTTSVEQIGAREIGDRLAALPGRSLQDLILTQPGWLYEGNAVLHPRGSEYQTQLVLDGIPLTDNRSPSFGPEVEADDLESATVYTAGFPAEFGRKLGGVIELNTRTQTNPGAHGTVVLSGGSYATASGFARVQETWGGNTAGLTVAGGTTSHYLNPVVPQNFTNTGDTGDFSGFFDRDLTASDRLSFTVRHELARFLIPNELVQEEAGQRENGDTFETLGSARYQHSISADALITAAGMVRDTAHDLLSNTNPTPIAAFQHSGFREGYFRAAVSVHHGAHELKAGIESDATILHENFSYNITNPDYFDDDTPSNLAFTGRRPDLEQAAFVQDTVRLGRWTVAAGLRWDHYQLLLNQNAFSPRLSVARYFPSRALVLHTSFDRIFQTPSSDNILLSSSSAVQALSSQFLRLPVQPARGNYYEGGMTKALAPKLRLDANVYRRDTRNFADDDQLLNTGVSYPIAFDHAVIYGTEAKLTLVDLARFTGFASYSYMVGNVWFPVTGGLFLADDAANAARELSGHFPNSQDQRHTLNSRLQYRVLHAFWIASGASYGSGLPFEYGGTRSDALAQYGAAVVDRINFARGRIRQTFAVSASLGVDLHTSDALTVRLQADGENLNGRLNVLDFGGLFSGNAIAPGRSGYVRLSATF